MKKKLFWRAASLAILSIAFAVFITPRTHANKFTGPVTADDPLPKELISELEKYVEYTMKKNDVPGLSIQEQNKLDRAGEKTCL